MNTQSEKIRSMVQLALLGAIIIVMAFTPFVGYIPLGFTRATIIHVPVILGSLLLGPKKGAMLGTLFGITSLISNIMTPTLTSFVFSPFYTLGSTHGNFFSLIICFVPRILVGIVPYYVYRLFQKLCKRSKKGQYVSLTLAGLAGSLTNTLLVMNMIFLFFSDGYAEAKEVTVDALYGVILSVIGINGVPEAIVAAIITATLGKVLLSLQEKKKL